jgi:WD40 repeat protein
MMRTMHLSPDGATLVLSSGFPRPNIRLVDITTGGVRASIAEGQQMPLVLAISADSQTVLTRSSNSLDLWHTATGAPKQQVPLAGPNQFMNAAASADGRRVFTLQGGKFWDGATLEPRGTLENPPGQQVHPVVLSADGSRLALGELLRGGGGGDNKCRVRVWDAGTGKELPLNLPALNGALTAVALAPDGKWVAAATSMGNIRLWDATTGQERVNVAEPAVGGGRPNMYTVVAAPAGDCLLGWSPQQMRLWDAATGRERAALPAPPDMPSGAAFAPNGKLLATADRSGRITLWNPASGTEVRHIQLPGHVFNLTFAADSRHLLTNNANGTITIFRLAP